MNYQDMLLELLYINDWHFLPMYPFKESLEDVKPGKDTEKYCKGVMCDLDLLVNLNR